MRWTILDASWKWNHAASVWRVWWGTSHATCIMSGHFTSRQMKEDKGLQLFLEARLFLYRLGPCVTPIPSRCNRVRFCFQYLYPNFTANKPPETNTFKESSISPLGGLGQLREPRGRGLCRKSTSHETRSTRLSQVLQDTSNMQRALGVQGSALTAQVRLLQNLSKCTVHTLDPCLHRLPTLHQASWGLSPQGTGLTCCYRPSLGHTRPPFHQAHAIKKNCFKLW